MPQYQGTRSHPIHTRFQILRAVNMKITVCVVWYIVTNVGGRAIGQAVSRRLPTAAARFRAQVRLCGICDGQSGTGVGFLRVLRIPLPILIPSTAAHSSLSVIRG
jgi:hypothetical protein